MKIKSLLLGSAVAMAGVSGAQAADAIFLPEPEPAEYVRVCDVYGAGFFYIPGTETCLKIGGYVRYQAEYEQWDAQVTANATLDAEDVELLNAALAEIDPDGDFAFVEGEEFGFILNERDRYDPLGRFQVNFDVRTETELGTLRSYAALNFDHRTRRGGATTTNLLYAFIELDTGPAAIRIGKTETPYEIFLPGGSGNVYSGQYGGWESTGLQVTFTPGNGFSAVLGVFDDYGPRDASWDPNFEGGIKYDFGAGSIGALAAYDGVTENFFAKAAVEVNYAPFTGGLQVYYSEGPGTYAIAHPSFAGPYTLYYTGTPLSTDAADVLLAAIGDIGIGGYSEWSALAYGKVQVSDTLAVAAQVQWFDSPGAILDDLWQFGGGLDYRPVSGLQIRPEVYYTTEIESWHARVRFQRSF